MTSFPVKCKHITLSFPYKVKVKGQRSKVGFGPEPPSTHLLTFRTALSLYIAHDGRKHKHNPTLSANKHVVQICRFSLSAAADGLADGSGERRTSLVNGIELKIAQSCRKVVPKSLPVSATTLPTALSFYIAQGRLRKNIRYPSCSQR